MSVTLLTPAMMAIMHNTRPPSKHHGPEISDTGPKAAYAVLMRKNLHRGRGSSLRKLQRIKRIEARLRPLRYEN